MILNPLRVEFQLNSFRDKDTNETTNTVGYQFVWGKDKPRGKFAVKKALETKSTDVLMMLCELSAELMRELDKVGYTRAAADPPEGSLAKHLEGADA